MSKLRLLFEKQGTACYISHLDLMRTFQRLFLRGGMFVKHSQGFHPHPIMSLCSRYRWGRAAVVNCWILKWRAKWIWKRCLLC